MSAQDRIGTARTAIAAAWRRGLDVLLPPHCQSCGALLDAHHTLCPPCWAKLDFITDPRCVTCGLPFEFAMAGGAAAETADAECAACIARPPAFGRARSAIRFEGVGRDLIHRFKYGDRIELSALFAKWMARAGGDLIGEADVLIPVPLHRWRLLGRRYNQAAMLAKTLGTAVRLPDEPLLLERVRATRSQVGLSADGRRRNVAGAFALRPGTGARLEGRKVLLIDDVMTSGATVEACARLLGREGALTVDVLTLARVVRGG